MRPPAAALVKPLTLVLLATGLIHPVVGAAHWDPIPPEDLAATECKSFPGSGAEFLFITQSFDTAGGKTEITEYRRVKIYNSKGAEEGGVLNIDYPDNEKIWSLDARIIKPNGASTEFQKKDFSKEVSLKMEGLKINRITLAAPNLSAGDIIEFKWSQSESVYIASYRWWYCQQMIPVRHYTFQVLDSYNDYNILYFNLPNADLQTPGRSQMRLDIKDIPPFQKEPVMAPMRDVRGWFLLFLGAPFGKDVWQEVSSSSADPFTVLTRPDGDTKRKAAELCNDANGPEDKLKRLYDFCQQDISNLDNADESADLQDAKNQEHHWAQDPDETLERKNGHAQQINELFATLARAAGFQVRLAISASRDATLNVRNPKGWLFIEDDLIAVRIGQAWHYYDPGDYYLPAGMLDRANEFAPVLVCDDDNLIFDQTPVAPAEKSTVIRKGRFALDADGNLEGEVEISWDGHPAIEKKKAWRKAQAADIDIEYRASITKILPSAEIGDLKWENLRGSQLPLVVRYRLKVSNYADFAGQKIILPINVFEHGAPAPFSAEKRKYPIFFDYAWEGRDDVQITIPSGYALDAASAPVNVGDPTGALGVRYQVGYKNKSHKLICKRDFVLGANGSIAFQVASYPALKGMLDAINRSDEHVILLKPLLAAPAAGAEAP